MSYKTCSIWRRTNEQFRNLVCGWVMSDIIDALMKISHAFRSCDLDVPDAILLKTHEQGIRLLCKLHQQTMIMMPMDSERGGRVIEHHDGSVWMEVEVYSIKVRWPAMKLAKPGGGYIWI